MLHSVLYILRRSEGKNNLPFNVKLCFETVRLVEFQMVLQRSRNPWYYCLIKGLILALSRASLHRTEMLQPRLILQSSQSVTVNGTIFAHLLNTSLKINIKHCPYLCLKCRRRYEFLTRIPERIEPSNNSTKEFQCCKNPGWHKQVLFQRLLWHQPGSSAVYRQQPTRLITNQLAEHINSLSTYELSTKSCSKTGSSVGAQFGWKFVSGNVRQTYLTETLSPTF